MLAAIAVVDVYKRAITTVVAVGKDPYGAALSPDGRVVGTMAAPVRPI